MEMALLAVSRISLLCKETSKLESIVDCCRHEPTFYSLRLTLYSLGNPSDNSDDETFKEGCDLQFAAAVMALNMNMNFLIGELKNFLVNQVKYYSFVTRYPGSPGGHIGRDHSDGSLQTAKTRPG